MKIIKLLCCILCAALLLSGCGPASNPTDDPSDSTAINSPNPNALKDSPPKSLKVLAIGNSYSIDAMEYLYQIAEEAGVEEIVLGNLFYGGCSLHQHLIYGTKDMAKYDYYKNTDGLWEVDKEYCMSQALTDEDWDYITLQQAPPSSGQNDTYAESLPQLLDYVQSKNSTAKLVWHMTWAYQSDYTGEAFYSYGKDQQKMYDMIISCVTKSILTEPRFSFVIPVGTAIQNARTSFMGDTLTRDGYHLDKQIGRYIAGLTWFAAITNSPIESITFNPAKLLITDEMLAVAKESATNAILNPYEVTQSNITEGTRP